MPESYPWEPEYGFTETNPSRLARALEAVRLHICPRDPDARTCDCKYGLTTDPQSHGPGRTGCPELRMVTFLLLHWAGTKQEPIDTAIANLILALLSPGELAHALEAVRRRICAYGPNARRCDCKYGLTAEKVRHIISSEQTGCPELRSAIHNLLHQGIPL